jgi:glycosyltransferase involved in cell wall biosynthesis
MSILEYTYPIDVSLVIPCYNEEAVIMLFYKDTLKILNPLGRRFELIFVDDGSRDNTLDIL